MNGQVAPILIFTYGNPSRGDDALGPAMYDLLVKHQRETSELGRVELLTDFQLQIEHAVDLQGRESVDVHFGDSMLDRSYHIDIEAAGELRVNSSLKTDLRRSPIPCFLGSINDFVDRHEVGLSTQVK